MAPNPLPLLVSGSHSTCKSRRLRSFLRLNGTIRIVFFSTVFFFACLIAYLAFIFPFEPSWRLPDRHLASHFNPDSLELADPKESHLVDPKLATSIPTPTPSSPSPSSPTSDVLTVEQIRDIVAPTKGFFSRDYSLGLGWNNVRYIFEASLLQAELLNRTLVLPSFVYARACEYNITVCADYATMVNKGDAIGSEEWREMEIEEQMGFRIPISVIVNMTHLRNQQPVITASEYLRLHGQDPEDESSSGYWPRYSYHTHPNVFETDKTKTPSLFVIQNHWYNPDGTNRVDYIPEAMKRRGNLERHPGPDNYDGSTERWPPLLHTELHAALAVTANEKGSPLDWNTAKNVLLDSPDLVGVVDLSDDEVVDEVLNAHDWEVLYTFPGVIGMEFTKIVVGQVKGIVPRSSIRGFRDDYHDLDADVVVLAGETHMGATPKPGAMRFTEELSRGRFASKVVHSFIPPQKIFDLAEVLSSRMRQRTEGRLYMGSHMRRGDFLQIGWAMETDIEDHVRRVKERLKAGRTILADLHDRGHWTTCDIEGAQLDPEQTTLPPPGPDDPFFVATDERDPDKLRKLSDAGAVFISDLLTIEDRRAFGWSLMFTDVMAFVEQQLLVRSGFFYGHSLSSFSGAIMNMRAGRGADPRTMLID